MPTQHASGSAACMHLGVDGGGLGVERGECDRSGRGSKGCVVSTFEFIGTECFKCFDVAEDFEESRSCLKISAAADGCSGFTLRRTHCALPLIKLAASTQQQDAALELICSKRALAIILPPSSQAELEQNGVDGLERTNHILVPGVARGFTTHKQRRITCDAARVVEVWGGARTCLRPQKLICPN